MYYFLQKDCNSTEKILAPLNIACLGFPYCYFPKYRLIGHTIIQGH